MTDDEQCKTLAQLPGVSSGSMRAQSQAGQIGVNAAKRSRKRN